jgi:sporulation protein YtfJ
VKILQKKKRMVLFMSEGINGFADTMLGRIKEMVDSNTVIGDSITAPDGTLVIPVSKVQVGFGSGGADLPGSSDGNRLIGGGGGGGLLVTPVAFVVISPTGGVKLMQIADKNQTMDRVLNLLPDLVDQVKKLFSKDKKVSKEEVFDGEEKALRNGLTYDEYKKINVEEIEEL